jgi:hypothetical protein
MARGEAKTASESFEDIVESKENMMLGQKFRLTEMKERVSRTVVES